MTTMSLHKSAKWNPGLRSDFEYRDLGIAAATKGKVLARVFRGKEPCCGAGESSTHHLVFEDVGEVGIEPDDNWYQVPNIKHEVLELSNDFQMIEICMLADFPTKEAQC